MAHDQKPYYVFRRKGRVHLKRRGRQFSRLYSSVLLTQYCSGDKIEKNEMGWACGAYGGEERRIQGFDGETGGKEALGRPRRRWKDNIKMDLQEVGCGGMD